MPKNLATTIPDDLDGIDAPEQLEEIETPKAQAQEEEADLKVYKFATPIRIADRTIDSLTLDFSKLSTKDMLSVASEHRKRNPATSLTAGHDPEFRILAVLRLNNIPYEDAEFIPWSDGLKIANQALFTLAG
jgi:hypothetical protein